jgi:uncharacterized membrane protein
MTFVNFIQEQWSIIILVVIAIVAVILFVKFLKLSPTQQKERIRTALLAIVTEMEKQYGPKTGVVKRSQAYSQLVKLFPVLTIFLSQETFDKLLEESLTILNISLQSNEKVVDYTGKSEEVIDNE